MIGMLLKRERLAQNMSQETLCHGICAPSYLSKIETGAATGTQELLLALFGAARVTYVTDSVQLDWLDGLYKEVLGALRGGESLPQITADMLRQCNGLQFSPRGVDACLLCALYDREQAAGLQFAREQLTQEQGLLYVYIKAKCLRRQGKHLEGAALLQTVKSASECWIYARIGEAYFLGGDYANAIVETEQGYQMCASQGNVICMLDCAVLAGNGYANVQGTDRMHHWYSLAHNINQVVKNKYTDYILNYNEGASMLMSGKPEESLAYFFRSEATGAYGSHDPDLLYQKMIYALLRVGRKAEGGERMQRIIVTDTPRVALLTYMLEHPDFMQHKEYCALLEACVQEARVNDFRGMADFYGYFLIEAYIATKQYKKAVQHMDMFKFSFSVPFHAGN